MNTRRGFLANILKLGVAAAVMPAATTYARNWVKPSTNKIWVPNPAWVDAPYEVHFTFDEASVINIGPPPKTLPFNKKDYWNGKVTPIIYKRSPVIEKHALQPNIRLDLNGNIIQPLICQK